MPWTTTTCCGPSAAGTMPGRIGSVLWLALEALDAGEVHRPRQGRAAPTLPCWTQFGAAVECAYPQAIGRRVGARGRRINRGAAFGAERVRPLVPAFSGLDVDFRCSALENECAGQAWHRRTKGSAGKGLAVSAMADSDLSRVDLCLEADLAAMAASGDSHRHFSATILAPCWARAERKDSSFGCFAQWHPSSPRKRRSRTMDEPEPGSSFSKLLG